MTNTTSTTPTVCVHYRLSDGTKRWLEIPCPVSVDKVEDIVCEHEGVSIVFDLGFYE